MNAARPFPTRSIRTTLLLFIALFLFSATLAIRGPVNAGPVEPATDGIAPESSESVSLAGSAAPAGHSQAPAQATPGTGEIVVRGRILYVDRFGDRNHPAAGLKVEIMDLDEGFPTTSQKLAEVTTDLDGRFVSPPISNRDPDGPAGGFEGTQDVFLKLHTDNGNVILMEAGTPNTWSWTSYEIDANDGIRRNVADGVLGFPTQYIVEQTPDVEALWTFVNLAEAWLYLEKYTGTQPGKITAFWSPTSLDGPRYDIENRTLHFRDEDAGYHTVIIQYAAYALLHNIYGTLPPSWEACINNPPTNPKIPSSDVCALVHGFSMFLPLAVYEDATFETPTVSRTDMDAAKAGTPGWQDGDLVPGRIVGSFWDIHENDQTEEEYDLFNAAFGDIWEVFSVHRPNTMREWWDGWKALGKNGCAAVGSLLQNTIDYNTPPTIQPIPDIVLDEDETAILDLKNYVDDADCPDGDIVFKMIDAGAPEAGVKLLPTNVISVTPEANWNGDTRVTIGISDGLVDVTASFNVIVNAINDCVRIPERIPDPAPAGYGQAIIMDLSGYAEDVEDPPNLLQWDAEVEPEHAGLLTIAGRGTRTLTFLLDPAIRSAYSVRVKLVVRDTDGCNAAQNVALYWTDETNSPPTIDFTQLKREYIAPINTTINVDLTGIASDKEDSATMLEWFVTNKDNVSAQENKIGLQVFDFVPFDGFVGSSRVELEVQDTGGARATADITLTWQSQIDGGNLPPEILRTKLKGLTTAVNAETCYELTDKARDPDHSRFSLRWFVEEFDDTTMFVGAQGGRRICVRARTDYEGCVTARFVVRDPRDASDTMLVTTCWRKADLYLPLMTQRAVIRAPRVGPPVGP